MICAMKGKPKDIRISPYHVDVLDGIRAYSVLMVLWFHFWQQSWLMPIWQLPASLRAAGFPAVINLDFIPRAGYLFVDMMLLLSGFCLFLPWARSALLGEKQPDWKQFYRKRLIRILPSYYFAVLAIFVFFSLPYGGYASAREALKDLLPTLTFTQVFFRYSYLYTKINGALWTVAVEMQFYLLFPLLAACMKRKPLLTWIGMTAVSVAYLQLYVLRHTDVIPMTVNQLPSFFGVFANGMAAAYLFVWISTKTVRSWKTAVPATLLSLGFWALSFWLVRQCAAYPTLQVWQAAWRHRLSWSFTGAILSTALALPAWRFVFSNRAARFLAGISYNLYIWHQWLAVKRKYKWRLPAWQGDTPPNQLGTPEGNTWSWKYALVITVVSFVIATLVTYLWEKPMADILNGRPSIYTGKLKKKKAERQSQASGK